MKKNLVLIRHTKSSWTDASLSDFDRPIRNDRKEDPVKIGRRLLELGLQADRIVCSPAKRTQQTCRILCAEWNLDFNKVELDERLYESSAEEYLSVIGTTPSAVNTLVVVGHNPSTTDLANSLMKHSLTNVPTTGVVWLELDVLDWEISKISFAELKCFVTPKTI